MIFSNFRFSLPKILYLSTLGGPIETQKQYKNAYLCSFISSEVFLFALFLQIICLLAGKFEMTSSRYSYPILLDIFYFIGSFWKLIFYQGKKMSNPTSLQDQTFFYGFLKVYYKSSSVAAPLLFIYKARHLLGKVQIGI